MNALALVLHELMLSLLKRSLLVIKFSPFEGNGTMQHQIQLEIDFQPRKYHFQTI